MPPDGSVFVWLAGEAGELTPLRRWARNIGLPEQHRSITGYWKRGTSDHDGDHDH